MAWYNRKEEGIRTSTKEKKEAPEGIWHQCGKCQFKTTVKDMKEHLHVCPSRIWRRLPAPHSWYKES